MCADRYPSPFDDNSNGHVYSAEQAGEVLSVTGAEAIDTVSKLEALARK